MREQVLAAAAGRERVVDAVKVLALGLVVLGHSLAWTTTTDGSATNTLDQVPSAYPLTWVLQLLPLFFLAAGTGLVRLATDPTAAGIGRRILRLASPVLPLALVTVAAAAVAGRLGGPTVGAAVGLLPVQLTWFVGVYLIVVALSPWLMRVRSVGGYAAWLAGIALVDVLRVSASPAIGWANLVLVWALFAALGMRLPRLRRMPRAILATGLVGFALAAVALAWWGPYSVALISTDALPGISNLAPPTLVLALAGLAQVCALALLWPVLEKMLTRDGTWLMVVLLGSRAMEVYLWHMLLFTGAIGVAIGLEFAPAVLSVAWWAGHALVAVVVVAAAWGIAPVARAAAQRIQDALGRLLPGGSRAGRSPVPVAVGHFLATVAGIAVLAISEGGLSEPFAVVDVLGLPYVPALSLLVLAVVVGVAAGLQGRQCPTPPA